MKYNYFVLGYNAINYFNEWYDRPQFQNTTMRFIDNGRQQVPVEMALNVIHQNEQNIGCAGGWNLACDIGFNHFGFEKIIVGQEDGRISEEIFEALLERCTPTMLCGTYNNSFEFSTYAIHRDTFNKVGRFDENFMFVGCEDNDYKHRCKLNGVEVTTLGISHYYNASIANNNEVTPRRASTHNAEYIDRKWNNYTYSEPFNGVPTPKYTDYFIEIFNTPEVWPSEFEFSKYKQSIA
jgi:GT2 family glycosyltransferase